MSNKAELTNIQKELNAITKDILALEGLNIKKSWEDFENNTLMLSEERKDENNSIYRILNIKITMSDLSSSSRKPHTIINHGANLC
jgi:hypothetical protein